MRLRVLHVTALTGILAGACMPAAPRPDTGAGAAEQAPASGATIGLDRGSYAPGSRVELRLTNHTSDQLGFNPCTRSIERQLANGGWTLIVERDRVCTMQLYLLEPRVTRVESTDLPPSLERGTYRLVLSFTRENAGTPAPSFRAVSGAFRVE
jgi:hypothetical protein